MKKYFLSLVSYNAWANHKLALIIIDSGDDAALLLQKSSFASIRETAFHIWDAEGIWMKRLKGESLDEWPSKNFAGATKDGLHLMVDGSRDYINYVESLNEKDFSTVIHYTNIKGAGFQNSIEEILAHVMNHSTFHRGQLVTMLRGAGCANLKTTDLIAFYREDAL